MVCPEDDPYVVESGFSEDGSFFVRVSADVLAGDEEAVAEVRAECRRRAELHRALLLDVLSG